MRNTLIIASAALAAVLALAGCGQAGPKDKIDKMARADVEAIVKDYLVKNPEVLVEAFTELDRRQKAADSVKMASLAKTFVTNKDDPSIGPKDAKITMVEFFDYNCGHCREAYPWMFKQLDAKTNDVRVVFKEFPILAPSSLDAAKAAIAANQQGKYREMHLALMHSHDLTPEGIDKMAQSVGLDMPRFRKDMASQETMNHIARVQKEAESASIQGTPGIFINGAYLAGFNEQVIDDMMKKARADLKAG